MKVLAWPINRFVQISLFQFIAQLEQRMHHSELFRDRKASSYPLPKRKKVDNFFLDQCCSENKNDSFFGMFPVETFSADNE